MMIAVSVLLILAALGVAYYWVDFFIKGGVHVKKDDWYIKFERAFPPADPWMAACAVVGSVGLITEQTYGLIFALLAAGSSIFLGLMDITFNLQNNMYNLFTTSSQMKFEAFANLWTIGLGIAVIVCLWSRIAAAPLKTAWRDVIDYISPVSRRKATVIPSATPWFPSQTARTLLCVCCKRSSPNVGPRLVPFS